MTKPIIGTVLGALTLFVWGSVSWMLIPWHDKTIKFLPEEQLISDTIKTVVEEPGFYIFPSNKSKDGRVDEKVWAEKYKKGPVGIVIFSPQGKDPMMASMFVKGFLINLLVAFLAMYVLSMCRERARTVSKRVVLVGALGVLASAAIHLPYANWFHFPCDFTTVAVLDTVVGFGLLGLVMAKFVPE